MAKKSPFSSKTEEYPERCEAKADGLLLDFCRFIRLQAAQDAWLRRLTRQHTMAFLGRGFFLFRVIFFCACVLDSISGVFRCFLGCFLRYYFWMFAWMFVCFFGMGWDWKKFGIFRVDLVWLRPMPKSTSSHWTFAIGHGNTSLTP